MMRELLFVGGPADGKRIEVNDELRHAYLLDMESGAKVEYRREKLAEGAKEYDIMFFGADGRGVIETLLAGYKVPNAGVNSASIASAQSRAEGANLTDVLGAALKETGFVICEFPADDDPCECCGKTNLQHYWRGSDPFSSDGTYYCAQCVVDEYTENNEAPNA